MMLRYFKPRTGRHAREDVFYVDVERALSPQELGRLCSLIGTDTVASSLRDGTFVEIGPRLSVETPFSSNVVGICRSAMGLPVQRVEQSIRYPMDASTASAVILAHLDRMREQVYGDAITTFDTGILPEPVRIIPFLTQGEGALRETSKVLGLGMDEADIAYYAQFYQKLGRNPTDVELFQLGNANSEHGRHWLFRGIQVIDGIEMPESLMDIVRAPLNANRRNSLVAFSDNSGVIMGRAVGVLMPMRPGHPSPFYVVELIQHISSTAETHNHPTMIAPFPGAATGIGGRIRDNRAVGRGGSVHAGFAGYCVGTLRIPGHHIPGEYGGGTVSTRHASALDVLVQGSNGVSHYGNEIGEPLLGGFARSFGQEVGGIWREFRKPVLYSAGLGRVFDANLKKRAPEAGMHLVRIGGPAYRIGVGGGAASSIDGTQDIELDLKSVQRGNAEMENRVNRVIQACAEMLERNPIESIHDQGAGGPSNVLTELMEPLGGRVDIRKIVAGDRTMSVLELWSAEYQEGYGLLVRPANLDVFKSVCARERVNCEVLGEITGDGRVVVYDQNDDTTPVDLSLKDILLEMPRKRFFSERKKSTLEPLIIPPRMTVAQALEMVCQQLHVGSKGFLVRKADRSVTGLVARQQCCGPMQLPVADAAVTADGYFGYSGAAAAFGEQPLKMLINPAAGARMAVAEMLTNLACVQISALADVKCRANWMWAAKRPGEGARMYDAAVAMRDIMLALGIAIDGGKDSLSMATEVNGEVVISPGQLVIKGYVPVPDIRKVVTPDLAGGGALGLISFGHGALRLGGSALAQALSQLGDESPDLDPEDIARLGRAFGAIQELIGVDAITAYHDRSDGGLIQTVLEMCISGNRGAELRFKNGTDTFPALFSEEAGMVFEYRHESEKLIRSVMKKYEISFQQIGITDIQEGDTLRIRVGDVTHLNHPLTVLRQWWERTSDALELQQSDPETVRSERISYLDGTSIPYQLTFTPKVLSSLRSVLPYKPRVAVIREEGTNGDREMAAAFVTAGLEPVDIAMEDILNRTVTSLDSFRGVAFPGGFSFADACGSARGWAAAIGSNDRASEMFRRFYERKDTFSLGVCNGFQLMVNMDWLPYADSPAASQPQLVHNRSGRFESRWVGVKILESSCVFFRGMEGSILGVWTAHGEGQLVFPDPEVAEDVNIKKLVPLAYVGPSGKPTEVYPYNPNGSPQGWAGLCSPDGRHFGMMPHPERCFLPWQWPWMPPEFRHHTASPWLQMFANALAWCRE